MKSFGQRSSTVLLLAACALSIASRAENAKPNEFGVSCASQKDGVCRVASVKSISADTDVVNVVGTKSSYPVEFVEKLSSGAGVVVDPVSGEAVGSLSSKRIQITPAGQAKLKSRMSQCRKDGSEAKCSGGLYQRIQKLNQCMAQQGAKAGSGDSRSADNHDE